MQMTCISKARFAEICEGIREDRELIIRHNPIGTGEEILLWMLLSCLVSYLSLTDQDTPCFTGKADARTYREAILYVLEGKMEDQFDPERYLDKMIQ